MFTLNGYRDLPLQWVWPEWARYQRNDNYSFNLVACQQSVLEVLQRCPPISELFNMFFPYLCTPSYWLSICCVYTFTAYLFTKMPAVIETSAVLCPRTLPTSRMIHSSPASSRYLVQLVSWNLMSDIELKGRKNDELRRIIINFVWSAEISERDMKEDNAGIVQWEECSQSCRNARLEIRGAAKVDDQNSESIFTALQNSNAIGTCWVPSNIRIEGYDKTG